MASLSALLMSLMLDFGVIFIGAMFLTLPALAIAMVEQRVSRQPEINYKHFWIYWACFMVIFVPIVVWWAVIR